MFPTQIALVDAAARAVATQGKTRPENPLRGSIPAGWDRSASRIYGSSPGTYGAGLEDLLSGSSWQDREELGRAYLDAASHAYGGAEGDGEARPGAFAERIAAASTCWSTGDDPARDLLEGSADVAFIGEFSAAVAALGGKADVIVLDTADPLKPKPRSVWKPSPAWFAHAPSIRASSPARWPRCGTDRAAPPGFAETVDRLVGFAETTAAIPGNLIESLHDVYLGDETGGSLSS